MHYIWPWMTYIVQSRSPIQDLQTAYVLLVLKGGILTISARSEETYIIFNLEWHWRLNSKVIFWSPLILEKTSYRAYWGHTTILITTDRTHFLSSTRLVSSTVYSWWAIQSVPRSSISTRALILLGQIALCHHGITSKDIRALGKKGLKYVTSLSFVGISLHLPLYKPQGHIGKYKSHKLVYMHSIKDPHNIVMMRYFDVNAFQRTYPHR